MKSISRIIITVILASMMAFGLTGCGKENVVATINGEKVTEPVYRICLWSTQRGLERHFIHRAKNVSKHLY